MRAPKHVLWTRNNIHMAAGVFFQCAAQKVVMEGDIATAAYDYQFWPDNFRDNLAYYKLDGERISPVHSVWPEHPNVLSIQQVDELIKGGTDRARERCASELAKGYYFPSCPVWSKRYRWVRKQNESSPPPKSARIAFTNLH
jgi:hypothetical protein